MKRMRLIVLLIFLIGITLRALLIVAPFIEDERKNIYIAQQISIAPEKTYLPMDHPEVTHPLLNLYFTKIGITLFGESSFGYRSIHWILGSLTLVLVYLLAKEWGVIAGAMAMAVVALNPYHLHTSVRTENACSLLFFTALVIWLFQRAITTGKERWMLLTGFVFGLAFLTKGACLLLLPAFFVYLFVDKEQRVWFRRKSLYAAGILFLLVISPWLIWTSVHGSSQLVYEPAMYDPSKLGLSMTALHFYLLQPLSWLAGVDPRMVSSWEYSSMDGVSGIVLLLGVIWVAIGRPDRLTRLLLMIFAVIMVVLSFFKKPGHTYGEFWWAEMSLIPAACMTGRMFQEWLSRRGRHRWLVVGFCVYMLINAVLFVRQMPQNILYPPSAQAPLVDQDYTLARLYETDRKYDLAEKELKGQKQFAPNNIEVDSYLGWIYYGTERYDQALIHWSRALLQEPDYVHVTNKLPVLSDVLLEHYLLRWRNNPTDPKIIYYLGILSYYDKKYNQAEEYLDRLLALDPDNAMGGFYRSLVSYQKKNYGEAARILKPLLQRHPGLGVAHYMLGKTYLKWKHYEEALDSFSQALTLNEQDIKSVYQLGITYEKLNAPLKAQKAFQRARSLMHDDVIIRLRSAQPPVYVKILQMKRSDW